MTEFNYNVNSFWTGHSYRFKGGESEAPTSLTGAMAQRTQSEKWAQRTNYKNITGAMKGQGFGSQSLTRLREGDMRTGLRKSFEQTKADTESQMARTLMPGDSRVRNFVGSSLDRAYATEKDNLNRGFRAEKVSDRALAIDMGGVAVSNEQGMAIGNAQMYNNALTNDMQRANQQGTFGSNLAGGMGEAAMDINYARQMGNTA